MSEDSTPAQSAQMDRDAPAQFQARLRHGRLRQAGRQVFSAIAGVLVPRSTLALLSQIVAALSVFALIRNALDLGLSSAFSTILNVYRHFVDLVIGPLDPYVKYAIAFLRSHFSFHLIFNPDWRYIFVVLQILFIRDAHTALSDGRYPLGIVRLIVGTAISLMFAVLVWTPNAANPLIANMTFSVIPVFAILVYDISMYAFSATIFFDKIGVGESRGVGSRRHFFFGGIRRSSERFAIVAIPSLFAFFIPSIAALNFPDGGIVAMLVGVIANCSYWLIHGSVYAARQSRKGDSFKAAFMASEAGRFGLAITTVLFWFFIFCAINSGGRLIGL